MGRPNKRTVNGAQVPLGRKYALASGLMEITYDTGAGSFCKGHAPTRRNRGAAATSRSAELTARVEKKGEGKGRKTEAGRSTGNSQRSAIPVSSLRSAFSRSPFALRPPWSPILARSSASRSTSFGVSRAHVFEGKVELRAVGGGNPKAILLEANESARVDVGKGRGRRGGSSRRGRRTRLCARCPSRFRSCCSTRAWA